MVHTPVHHPLAPLTSDEIHHFKELLAANGFGGPTLRFTYVMLREPDHATLDAFRSGALGFVPREISALLLDTASRVATQVVVDLVAECVVSTRRLDPAVDGWAPILDEDYVAANDIVKADARYVAALAERGVTDLSKVVCAPLSAGVFGHTDEVGRRMIRVLSFYANAHPRGMYGHPIEGIVAHVDLLDRSVVRLTDTGYLHVPQESGDYLDPRIAGPPRRTLKPIRITQPHGPSFAVEDNVLTWENWQVRIGFNGREGLTLHDVGFHDRGRLRPILRRAAISEMVVPYADPLPTHNWQNYFDAGEYQFGRLANSLVLGCDCLGEIQYLDATVVDDFGAPLVLPNAICIHEEDYGTLWKHTDVVGGTRSVRRQRRLVMSFFVTVGNYDYGFYWHLYLDGKLELECKATGIVFTSGRPDGYEFASEMAPRLGAPLHQHLFSARLDIAIDGNKCHVDELDVQRVPIGPTNPLGNAFTRSTTRLSKESDAQRVAANDKGRVWRIASSEATNRLGHATAFTLFPEGQPLLLAADEASIRQRATFATKHLWVTQFARDELWAAGYSPNQHPGGAGLPAYASANRNVDGEDIVVWHTFGLTHFPRTEDWPMMSVDTTGFVLKPEGFFDRNPTLDVPEDPNGQRQHCCAPTDERAKL